MFLIFSYFLSFFSNFHNTVIIYNMGNQSNDATESQSKITRLNKMWSLKILTMFKCESRASLHAVKYK